MNKPKEAQPLDRPSPARRLAGILIFLTLAMLTPPGAAGLPAVDPQAVTLEAIDQLRSAQEVFPDSAAALEAVIARLENSLVNPAGDLLHLDACHLRPHPEGLDAFIEARQAVIEIGQLLGRGQPAYLAQTLTRIRAQIAEAYLLLADAALQEARALAQAPSSESQVEIAEDRLADALDELAWGRFRQALQSLRQTWQHAQLALPEAGGSGDHPLLNVLTPADGSILFASPVTVAGMVQILTAGPVGPDEVTVAVNGIPAAVANRGFEAPGVSLREGLNAIIAVAREADGDTATACLAVRLDSSPRARLTAVSGDGQTAPIDQPLPQSLVVRLNDADGSAISGAQVVFRVVQGNGRLGSGSRGEVVETDAGGEARTTFVLGSRAGIGANRVRATAAGVQGEVIFSATATTATPDTIDVVNGGLQSGGVGEALPLPLTVVVTDGGQNPVAGVPVSFAVTAGGGSVGGATAAEVSTDSDGRASVGFVLGPEPGRENHRVEARFTGLINEPATFKASAHVLGDPADTRLSGIVLDNQGEPVPGTALAIRGTSIAAAADSQGRFVLAGVPVGEVILDVDGSTTPRPGVWAHLTFDLHTLPGIDNVLPRPVFILPIDVASGRIAGGEEDVTVTTPEVPGFSLTVLAGSATFPDGSPTGLVSVTPVHADKIPMAPGAGIQPRFIVTVQPPGAHFDPPAPVTFPNADGLAPGTVTEMHSFDHDLGEFVSIGTGTVSDDGLTVRSDPGFGIVKAGWHFSAPRSLNGASAALRVGIDEPPVFLCCGAAAEPRTFRAAGEPSRDTSYSWTVGDDSILSLEPSGSDHCQNRLSCDTTATVTGCGETTVTSSIASSTTGETQADTVAIVAAGVELLPLSPSELILGDDLTVSYRVEAPAENGFDRAELSIRNRFDTVVFRLDVDSGPGIHTATWERGKWNQPPYAGAFANPRNSPYSVEVAGIREAAQCSSGSGQTIQTRLVLAADVHDPPPSETSANAARLGDLLDALKVVMRNGSEETVFAGPGAITATPMGPGDTHVVVDADELGTLADGDYEVLFRDLRDAIGNFADDDDNPSNGIQPIRFDLSLR